MGEQPKKEHPIVWEKRFSRAWALEHVFRKQGWDVETVRELTDEQWLWASIEAKLKSVPSDTTKAILYGLMTKNPYSE